MTKKGRPAKPTTHPTATITLKIPSTIKNHIVHTADGYDLTITEYLLSLVLRDTGGWDAEETSKS